MGFRLKRTYALRWESGDLAGLEIDMRATSVATMIELQAFKAQRDEKSLAAKLVEHVVRWNLVDENDEILPLTVESLTAQEPVVLAAIGKQWWLATAGVSAPLDDGSTSSTPSESEASIPMDAL